MTCENDIFFITIQYSEQYWCINGWYAFLNRHHVFYRYVWFGICVIKIRFIESQFGSPNRIVAFTLRYLPMSHRSLIFMTLKQVGRFKKVTFVVWGHVPVDSTSGCLVAKGYGLLKLCSLNSSFWTIFGIVHIIFKSHSYLKGVLLSLGDYGCPPSKMLGWLTKQCDFFIPVTHAWWNIN